jgi:PDZ domain
MIRQLVCSGFLFVVLAQGSGVNAAFERFWAAESPEAAAALVDDIIKTGVTFDDAYRRLQQGRSYPKRETGRVSLSNRTSDGVQHFFALNVPAAYDPARKYQVRFHLHGGVGGRQTNVPPAGAGGPGSIVALEGPADVAQIYIVPFAWNRMPWWSTDQVLNLRAILDTAKRLYNIDENRVVVSGVSDGGTGAYYIAMRETTEYASFLPLNGFWPVLTNQDIQQSVELYPNNLRNKPWFVVNGGRDPLYPSARVDPYIEHFKKGGVTVEYRPQPEAGHNTRWWPEVRDAFETFVRSHPRNPLPDTVTWETADPNAFNRAHWLAIDGIRDEAAERTSLPDLNDMVDPPAPDFGVRSVGSRINRVVPGSNADRIGVKAGDALVRLNDQPVRVTVGLDDAFEEIERGSTITLLVARNNQPVELTGRYEPEMVTRPPRQVFARRVPSGRVDVTRTGNTVRAATRGVDRFTLLVSPDQFDFSKPVKVIADGKTVFDAKVKKDLRTLLEYAARDNDRTMLFGAEIHVALKR